MAITKTPLTQGQYLRLINVVNLKEKPLRMSFVNVEGVDLTKIELKFSDHEETIFLTREDFDFVKNEIKLERN